ncbi:MAG: hypothetical protein ACE148_17870 [Vicinamibacterales bacterium]
MNASHLQVSFMPWAGIGGDIRIGPVTFWPFYGQATARVKDETIRNHLKKYFGCYVDYQGRPVDSVTICSHGPADFAQLTREKATEVRAAVDALIFSIVSPATQAAVCADKNSMGPPSADRYELITQDFCPGDDHITILAGSVVSGGWRIDQVSFPKPWSTGGVGDSPDKKLLDGLSKVFGSRFPADSRARLLRSLEWFRLAHIESDHVSRLSKVVMMATAFEILLDVPDRPNKKGWIADRLDELCATSGLGREERQTGGRTLNHTRLAWCAWDFYNLRNSVVHGDVITPEKLRYEPQGNGWLTHLIVADLVFWECVTRELYAHGYVGESVREFLAMLGDPNEPHGIAERTVLDGLAGFDFQRVHRALGWAAGPGGAR